MALNATALRAVVLDTVYNSLIRTAGAKIDKGLSPSQRSAALESYKDIATAVADAMIPIISHIKINSEITSTEFLSFGTGTGYFLNNPFGTQLQSSVGETVAGVIKTRSTIR